MAPNKMDANDTDGLAHLAEAGFYREVGVKGHDSMLVRTLVTAPSYPIGLMGLRKTFGLECPKAAAWYLK